MASETTRLIPKQDSLVALSKRDSEALNQGRTISYKGIDYLALRSDDPKLEKFYIAALQVIFALHHQEPISSGTAQDLPVFDSIQVSYMNNLKKIPNPQSKGLSPIALLHRSFVEEIKASFKVIADVVRMIGEIQISRVFQTFRPNCFLAPGEKSDFKSPVFLNGFKGNQLPDLRVIAQEKAPSCKELAIAQFLFFIPKENRKPILSRTFSFLPQQERETFFKKIKLMKIIFHVYLGLGFMERAGLPEIESFYEIDNWQPLRNLPLKTPDVGLSVQTARSFLYRAFKKYKKLDDAQFIRDMPGTPYS